MPRPIRANFFTQLHISPPETPLHSQPAVLGIVNHEQEKTRIARP